MKRAPDRLDAAKRILQPNDCSITVIAPAIRNELRNALQRWTAADHRIRKFHRKAILHTQEHKGRSVLGFACVDLASHSYDNCETVYARGSLTAMKHLLLGDGEMLFVCRGNIEYRSQFVRLALLAINELKAHVSGAFLVSLCSREWKCCATVDREFRYSLRWPDNGFFPTDCVAINREGASQLLDLAGSLPIASDDPIETLYTCYRRMTPNFFSTIGGLARLTNEPVPMNGMQDDDMFSFVWPPDIREISKRRQSARSSVDGCVMAKCKGKVHRGIVICAGGMKYFPCAWACVRLLRRLGCTLPVEFWYLGQDEMTPRMKALARKLGVRCVDAHKVREQHPARILNGWELKCYAILHSRFREVLLLDADNVPVVNPEFLFHTPEYREHGAIFWPDIGSLGPEQDIWKITGVPYVDVPAFESGQIVVDKKRCWPALNLAMHYNEHSDFYYQHIYGDKDTFLFGFRKVGKTYAMPSRGIDHIDGTLCQHDFQGRRIFQHRIKKWKLEGNSRTPGFLYEEECIGYLDELRGLLQPKAKVKMADRIDGIHKIKGMKRNGIVPNPAPPTVELMRLKRGDARMVKHRALLKEVVKREFAYPAEKFAGHGIVICGGGAKYFPGMYVLVRLLRQLGCTLPVEVWHLGAKEMTGAMRGLLESYDVRCVDGRAVRRVHPARRLGGWELKCYAVLHSRFQEVLLLDADNCPVRDPGFLFESAGYRKTGAVFWPDFGRFAKGQAVWVASGVKYRDEPEFESGQMVIDKARCWRALNVAMHLNEHSEWWYRLVHGDKDTFHLAWRKIGQDYAMPAHPVRALDGVMLQYDFAGRLLFQHRNFAKWTLQNNRRVPGFRLEKECLGFVEELRAQWVELPTGVRRWAAAGKSAAERMAAARLCAGCWEYRRVGHDRRAMTFLPDGRVGDGMAGCEVYWELRRVQGRLRLEVFSPEWRTFSAWEDGAGGWRGRWERFEGMAVELGRAEVGGRRAEDGGEVLNAQVSESDDSRVDRALEEAVA